MVVLSSIFFSSSSLSLWLLFFYWCGAKTSNPAATNLVWAARPPFAHKDGLRVLNISGEAPDSLCLGAWSSICFPVLSVKRAHISWFFFTPLASPFVFLRWLLFSCPNRRSSSLGSAWVLSWFMWPAQCKGSGTERFSVAKWCPCQVHEQSWNAMNSNGNTRLLAEVKAATVNANPKSCALENVPVSFF